MSSINYHAAAKVLIIDSKDPVGFVRGESIKTTSLREAIKYVMSLSEGVKARSSIAVDAAAGTAKTLLSAKDAAEISQRPDFLTG